MLRLHNLNPHFKKLTHQARHFSSKGTKGQPRLAVAAVVIRQTEPPQVLMVKRGTPPKILSWTVPGGKVKFGETCEQAVIREIQEEAGLTIHPGPILKVVDLLVTSTQDWDPKTMSLDQLDYHYCVLEYLALLPAEAEGVAGSDALELIWVDQNKLEDLKPIADEQIISIVNSGFKMLAESKKTKATE